MIAGIADIAVIADIGPGSDNRRQLIREATREWQMTSIKYFAIERKSLPCELFVCHSLCPAHARRT
jgi:hypothetical protein